ncbi:MAG: SOS response-associated peptidase, partial [Candidatus Latescibacterota bacterium]
PRYNLAPTQPVAAVVQRDRRVLELLTWGLVPSWSKDPSGGVHAINARAETLTTKPAFRNALQRRRCVVLASGFFEWRHEGRDRVPMFIRLADGRPLGLAGLWEEWTSAEGEPLRTCTIITVAANPFLASIHDRMPAILEPAAVSRWLDPNAAGAEPLLALLRPYAAEDLVVY